MIPYGEQATNLPLIEPNLLPIARRAGMNRSTEPMAIHEFVRELGTGNGNDIAHGEGRGRLCCKGPVQNTSSKASGTVDVACFVIACLVVVKSEQRECGSASERKSSDLLVDLPLDPSKPLIF